MAKDTAKLVVREGRKITGLFKKVGWIANYLNFNNL